MNSISHYFWLPLFSLFTALFLGCAQGDGSDDSGSSGDSGAILRSIAGTSAIGRPGSWSNNCLAQACARADNSGNFLLSTQVSADNLMFSDIPNADGSKTRLYSRYRFNPEITTSLVNINPSTHAILDMWANYRQGQSIDSCSLDANCTSQLLAEFTENVEQTIISALDTLLADAWPAQRNPFDDVYIASSTDPLDAMHDYLNFVVTSNELRVYNNNDEILTTASLSTLFTNGSLAGSTLSLTDYQRAQNYPPTAVSGNAITLSANITPSQPSLPPVEAVVNVSRSSSPNGDLSFSHELTVPSGTTTTFVGDIVSTTLTESGSNIWVVTATDTSGASRVQGYVIELLGGSQNTPTFGGEGSCITPSHVMNANKQNICIEVQNGSAFRQCDAITSSVITLVSSPAPCAQQTQNEGDLFGICTTLYNESRVFYYENPTRPNLVESFEEKQQRIQTFCTETLEGRWLNSQPPAVDSAS